MARIKTSGLISDIRGKIQGTVFQGYKGGIFVRSSSTNINRLTDTQRLTRSYTSYLQNAWRDLSEENRLKWINFAMNYSIHQKHGMGKFISGQQAFLKINHYRLQYSFPIFEYPRFGSVTMELPTWSITRNGENLDVNCSPTINFSDVFHVFYITPPMNQSIKNPSSFFRLMRFETSHIFSYTISAEYIAAFGALPDYLQFVNIKTALASKRNGLLTPWNRQQLQLNSGGIGWMRIGSSFVVS